MVADPTSVFALHRFGFGPDARSAAIAGDPREAILADLDRPGAGQLTAPHLRSGGEAARAAFNARAAARAARTATTTAAPAAADTATSQSATPQTSSPPASSPQPPGPQAASGAAPPAGNPLAAALQQVFRDEAGARIDAAFAAEIGFAERLTWFWSNHFCVSVAKAGVRPLAGAYEREAIRPHVLGRFADLLLAAETHPAMLVYLDNARSTGPNSPAGRNRGVGLNENLAREILELHTLGVRSVYAQDDVTRFANILTGWSVVPPRLEHGGEFTFNARMHEPGPQTLIGLRVEERDFEQGRAALQMLARHPATAKHLSEKLVRHFVSDRPVPALTERLAARFLDTDGDLKEVARTLVTAPESWDMGDRKLKRPSEWMIAAARATGRAPEAAVFIRDLNLLGEPLWRPPAPNGFADGDAAWIDGLAGRLDVANAMAHHVPDATDPAATAEVALGALATTETRTAIRRAESRTQALTLLFMAPEFQRR